MGDSGETAPDGHGALAEKIYENKIIVHTNKNDMERGRKARTDFNNTYHSELEKNRGRQGNFRKDGKTGGVRNRAERLKMKQETDDNKLNFMIYSAIARHLVGELVKFDAYLKKQNQPKIYKRFKKVIKIYGDYSR